MLKFCTFCGRKLDTEGFCTNSKCPDYKRKELIETEKKELAEKAKSTQEASKNKAQRVLLLCKKRGAKW